MTFKDIYLDDVENTFFDTDEFAEIHTVDGQEYTAVVTELGIQQSEITYRNRANSINTKETAISSKGYVIYLKESEFKRKVTSNALITFDGKKYFIKDVKRKGGVIKLTIGINEV